MIRRSSCAHAEPAATVRQASTGTPGTHPDAGWTPLIPTLPYPEYVSGRARIAGATTNGLSYLFGARHTDLRVTSPLTGATRHFATANFLDQQTMPRGSTSGCTSARP